MLPFGVTAPLPLPANAWRSAPAIPEPGAVPYSAPVKALRRQRGDGEYPRGRRPAGIFERGHVFKRYVDGYLRRIDGPSRRCRD